MPAISSSSFELQNKSKLSFIYGISWVFCFHFVLQQYNEQVINQTYDTLNYSPVNQISSDRVKIDGEITY